MTDSYVTAVQVGELFADDTYQRPLDHARAKRMAGDWECHSVGQLPMFEVGA